MGRKRKSPPEFLSALIFCLPLELLMMVASFVRHPVYRMALRSTCKVFHSLLPVENQKHPCAQVMVVSGQLALLKWYHEKHRYPIDADWYLRYSAIEGQLHVLEWLYSKRYRGNHKLCEYAAYNGHIHVIAWLRSKGCAWGPGACAAAASQGHLDCLRWLRSPNAAGRKCAWNSNTCNFAAKGGYLDVLVWAYEHGCTLEPKAAAMRAVEGDHVKVLEWLEALKDDFQYDKTFNPQDSTYACEAARSGSLYVLGWLAMKRSPTAFFVKELFWHAATNGHLHVMKWLFEAKCPWEESTCAAGAYGGLEGLKWLRIRGCPWDRETCYASARNGRLDVLQWARAHECPWDKQHTRHCAVMNSAHKVVEWIDAQPEYPSF